MIVNKTGNANVAARPKFSELSLAADGVEKPWEFEFESDQVYESDNYIGQRRYLMS